MTGGARSGKSSFAQELALKSSEPVLFVATATADDEEMRLRIEKHQRARPVSWKTLEAASHIGRQILQRIDKTQTVIIDCITLLLNNIFMQYFPDTEGQLDAPLIERETITELDELIDCINSVDADFIIVTNEVGLGIVPADRMSRLYRDLLGNANQMLAQHADKVYLMVAGMPLLLKPPKAL
ncbi:bifunctional adenosylcobinamide kinase/adenosylcobinamide-phosphate guanylyltransferase [Chloroflexota bacterium]